MELTFWGTVEHVIQAAITFGIFWLVRHSGTYLHRFFDDARSHIVHKHVKDEHTAALVACSEGDCSTFPDVAHMSTN